MNPVYQAAAETVRLGWIMGVMTALFLFCFIGWAWWAYSARNRRHFEELSRMPLKNGDEP